MVNHNPPLSLVIDAGNTRVKLAVFDRGRIIFLRTAPDWPEQAIRALPANLPGIRSAITSSVRAVPEWLLPFFRSAGIAHTDLTWESDLPVRIAYGSPETLGKDRIAAAAGAAAAFPGKPVLVIDAGTALTLDLVTAGAVFIGGNISPGLRMRFSALHGQTFGLPLVEPGGEVPVIGTNTREAILAGVVNGMVYEIDNSINSLRNKYYDLQPILTGGDSAYLINRLKNTIFAIENLVLNGLNRILMHHFSDHDGPATE